MERDARTTRPWFILTGALYGSFAVSAADIEAASNLDRVAFGAVLAAGLLMGAAANVVAGRQCARRALPAVARRWGVGWSLAVMLAALVGGQPLVAIALVAVWVTLAGVDVTMNISATAALGRRPGRLLFFNTWFNTGAVFGALSTAAVAAWGGSWRLVWASLAVLALWAALRPVPTTIAPLLPTGDVVPRRSGVTGPVLVLAAALFGAGAVGAGLDVWGVVYLRQDLGASLTGGAVAVVVGQVVAILARIGAGAVAAGSGVRAALTATGAAVISGIVLLTTASTVPVASLGLAVTMGVLSCAWPLALLQAASASERPAAALGVVSAAGQIGRVVGPFAVASMAQRTDLVSGLRLLLIGGVLLAASAVLARSSSPAPMSRPAPPSPVPTGGPTPS